MEVYKLANGLRYRNIEIVYRIFSDKKLLTLFINDFFDFIGRDIHVSLNDVLKIHGADTDGNIFGNTKPYIDLYTLLNIKKSLMLVKVNKFETYKLDNGYGAKTKARFYYMVKNTQIFQLLILSILVVEYF